MTTNGQGTVKTLLSMVLLSASIGVLAGELPAGRRVTSLDQGWRFQIGDIADALPVGVPVTGWYWCVDQVGESKHKSITAADVDMSDEKWKKGTAFDAKEVSAAWFRTELPGNSVAMPAIEFHSLKGNGILYVNGKRIFRVEGNKQIFLAELDKVWKREGTNVIAVLLKTTDKGGSLGDISFFDLSTATTKTDSPVHPGYDDSGWRVVEMPHDYVVEGPVTDKGADGYERNIGWYRRTITIPELADGQRVWIELDGIYRQSRLWFNGVFAKVHNDGYAHCRLDVTDLAKQGENVLTVQVDPRHGQGWWYDGGGIYRHTRMIIVEPVHVVPDGVFVISDIPDPKDGITAPAKITIRTMASNTSGKKQPAKVVNEIMDAAGAVVARSEKSINLAVGEFTDAQSIDMPKAELWSTDNPNLYTMRTTIEVAGKKVDQLSTTFGVRKVEFDAERGLILNGKPVKIKGTCNHETHAGVGLALPDRLHVWRLEELKKMGSNAYRCAHNQNSPIVYKACDRLGILVVDEFRHFDDGYLMKVTENASFDNMEDQINQVKRNRNHPSIIIWSLCNEEGVVQNTPLGAGLAAIARNIVNTHDGTRLTTAAVNDQFQVNGICATVDVLGFNYMSFDYDRVRELFPHKAGIGTETSAELATRGIYSQNTFRREGGRGPVLYGDLERGYLSAYSQNRHGWGELSASAWKKIVDRPWMAGCFVWSGFDYKGEPSPFGQPEQPSISTQYGIIDTCGFPKDVYWYYKSWWTSEPVLHVFPHWNWPGREGENIAVWVYSNCETVELFLNGKSLGKKTMEPNSYLTWDVTYTAGKLEAKGITKGGQSISTVVETTGVPAGIALAPDRTELIADGQDLAWVGVSVRDGEGRVVPTANNMIRFNISGPGKILGVGNGDPSCHEPDKASQRSAFNGYCMVLVQTIRKAGRVTLTAEGDGLKPVTVNINSKIGSVVR